MRIVSGTCVAVAVFIGMEAAPRAVSAQEPGGDPAATEALEGDWVLNPALSDDPSELIPRPAVPPGARGRPPERPPSGTAQLRQAIERFSLGQTDSTVVISYPDRDLVLHVDGQKHVDAVSDDLKIEYRAWREGPALVIERRRDGGLTLTERYSIVSATGRLHILTRLTGDRLPAPIAFVRVYDHAPD